MLVAGHTATQVAPTQQAKSKGKTDASGMT